MQCTHTHTHTQKDTRIHNVTHTHTHKHTCTQTHAKNTQETTNEQKKAIRTQSRASVCQTVKPQQPQIPGSDAAPPRGERPACIPVMGTWLDNDQISTVILQMNPISGPCRCVHFPRSPGGRLWGGHLVWI